MGIRRGHFLHILNLQSSAKMSQQQQEQQQQQNGAIVLYGAPAPPPAGGNRTITTWFTSRPQVNQILGGQCHTVSFLTLFDFVRAVINEF
jgi:hypothetical protein